MDRMLVSNREASALAFWWQAADDETMPQSLIIKPTSTKREKSTKCDQGSQESSAGSCCLSQGLGPLPCPHRIFCPPPPVCYRPSPVSYACWASDLKHTNKTKYKGVLRGGAAGPCLCLLTADTVWPVFLLCHGGLYLTFQPPSRPTIPCDDYPCSKPWAKLSLSFSWFDLSCHSHKNST